MQGVLGVGKHHRLCDGLALTYAGFMTALRPTRRRYLQLTGGAVAGLATGAPWQWAQAQATAQPSAAITPAGNPMAGISATQILLGQTISLENAKNDYAVAIRQGIEAAMQQINATGGVAGRRLQIKVMDDHAKPAEAAANARQLVADGVFALFGPIEGGPSTAVMAVANELGVPLFGPMAGSPGLRRPLQPLVFPVRAEHREEFRALLNHGASLGMRRVGFLQADSDTGRQHLDNVRRIAGPLGMEVRLPMPFKGDITDAGLQAFVQQLAEKQVELVFNHGSAGVYERLIRLSRQAGLNTSFWGINSGSAQLAKHLGPLANGMVFAQVMPSPWERKTALTRAYQDAFRALFRDQDYSYGSLEGYVTTRALAEALRRCGRDLSRPRWLAAMKDAQLDIDGFKISWPAAEHAGATLVDTAIVTRDGRFRH